MAKSKYIKTLTKKDMELLKMTSVTGYFNSYHAKNLNNTSKARLTQLCNSKYLERHMDIKTNSYIYKLDKAGYDLFGKDNCYTVASIGHDSKLTEYYINNPEQRDNLTSGKSYAKEHNLKQVGIADMVLVRENVPVVGIEIITDNYKEIDIIEKIEYAEEVHMELKLIHTSKEE